MKTLHSSWLAACLVTLLVALTLASVLHLSDAKAAANDAHANLARVTALASRIQELRKSENRAVVHGEQQIESSKNWVERAQAAQIPEHQISKIDPLPPKKIGNTDYSRDDVFIELKGVTAHQLLEFLLKCEAGEDGYQSSSVHLSRVPNAPSDRDLWNADLVLTRMLFTATNPTPGR